jgi:hypothetical protein
MGNDTKAPKASKKNKTTLRFTGSNGDLQVVSKTIAPGNIQTYVVHTRQTSELTSKGKAKKARQRGASEMHKDEASAKSTIDKIVAAAVKMGWVQKTKTVRVKSDQFTLASLPAANSVAKK